ncbi:MAG: TlpA family protein disulfide reductase [Bacillota bacterium]
MKKKISILLIAALLIGGLSFFYLQNTATTVAAEVGTEIGMEAPGFSLINMNDQEVNLSDYRGKKVFLNFWASWCPPCRQEMPDMQKLHEEHGDEIAVLAVNIGENKSTVINFMMQNKLNLPVLLDLNKSIAQNYLVRAIPTTYILDEDGIIIEKTFGALNYQSMLELSRIND